jgi:predicted aspartyl protease
MDRYSRFRGSLMVAGLAALVGVSLGACSSSPTTAIATSTTASSAVARTATPQSATSTVTPPSTSSGSLASPTTPTLSSTAPTPASTSTAAGSSTVSGSRRVIPPGGGSKLGLRPLVVPVKIVHHKSSVQVLVQLKIHSKPFYFLVDTGASVTLIDSTVAKSLGLAAIGAPGKATTIGCSAPIQPVALADWSVGSQALPGSLIPSQRTELAGKKIGGIPVAGLLGADLYYLYGTMTVDFKNATMTLGHPAPTGGQSFPIAAHLTAGGVSVIADVSVHGNRGGFLIDTGAAVTDLDSKLANSSALKKVGATTKIGAVSCTTSVQPVVFDNVRIGTVKLPTVTAASSANALTARSNGKIQGLIGADILSTFGSVTFDFKTQRVILG